MTSDAITRYRQLICSYFKSKIFSERKLLEYPWHLLKLGNSKDLTDFLSSDITILTNLYSPLTKFELFSYLKCTRMSSDASVFVKALEAHKTKVRLSLYYYSFVSISNLKVSKEEYARLTHTVGNFMIENGNNDIATKLFQSCLTSFVELYSEFSAEVSMNSIETIEALANFQGQ